MADKPDEPKKTGTLRPPVVPPPSRAATGVRPPVEKTSPGIGLPRGAPKPKEKTLVGVAVPPKRAHESDPTDEVPGAPAKTREPTLVGMPVPEKVFTAPRRTSRPPPGAGSSGKTLPLPAMPDQTELTELPPDMRSSSDSGSGDDLRSSHDQEITGPVSPRARAKVSGGAAASGRSRDATQRTSSVPPPATAAAMTAARTRKATPAPAKAEAPREPTLSYETREPGSDDTVTPSEERRLEEALAAHDAERGAAALDAGFTPSEERRLDEAVERRALGASSDDLGADDDAPYSRSSYDDGASGPHSASTPIHPASTEATEFVRAPGSRSSAAFKAIVVVGGLAVVGGLGALGWYLFGGGAEQMRGRDFLGSLGGEPAAPPPPPPDPVAPIDDPPDAGSAEEIAADAGVEGAADAGLDVVAPDAGEVEVATDTPPSSTTEVELPAVPDRIRRMPERQRQNFGRQWRVRAARMLARHDERRAIELYTQSLIYDPESSMAAAGIARAYLESHRVALAIPWARRAADLEPSSADLHVLLGDILAESGDRAAARVEWQEALAINPRHRAAQRRLD